MHEVCHFIRKQVRKRPPVCAGAVKANRYPCCQLSRSTAAFQTGNDRVYRRAVCRRRSGIDKDAAKAVIRRASKAGDRYGRTGRPGYTAKQGEYPKRPAKADSRPAIWQSSGFPSAGRHRLSGAISGTSNHAGAAAPLSAKETGGRMERRRQGVNGNLRQAGRFCRFRFPAADYQ